jgi:hypothetical protein
MDTILNSTAGDLAQVVRGLSQAFSEAQGWPAWATCNGLLDGTIVQALCEEADRRGTCLAEIVRTILDGVATKFHDERHAAPMRRIVRSIITSGGLRA